MTSEFCLPRRADLLRDTLHEIVTNAIAMLANLQPRYSPFERLSKPDRFGAVPATTPKRRKPVDMERGGILGGRGVALLGVNGSALEE